MPATRFYTVLLDDWATTESYSRVTAGEAIDLVLDFEARGKSWQAIECDLIDNRCRDVSEDFINYIDEYRAEYGRDPYAGCRLTVREMV